MSTPIIKSWFDKRDPKSMNESLGHDLVGAFTKIFGISRKSTWPVLARHTKATEELGELGTCVLVEQGYMKHKKLKESSIGESADTIICVLDTLFASFPSDSREDLIRSLTNELFTKSDKWNTIVDDLNATEPCKTCEGTGNDPGGLPACRTCQGRGEVACRSVCANGPVGGCLAEEGCLQKQMKNPNQAA